MRTTHNDITQGTFEWLELKWSRMGSTSAHLLMTNGKNDHGLGAGLLSKMDELIGKRFTTPEFGFSNDAMDNGTMYEPAARQAYESATFNEVREVGYVSQDNWFGDSPDGLVGSEGCIEIKCPGAKAFVNFVRTREIDNKYYAQMQWHMYICDCLWCDFIVYHPEMPNEIIIERVRVDNKYQQTFQEKTKIVEELLDLGLEKFKKGLTFDFLQ